MSKVLVLVLIALLLTWLERRWPAHGHIAWWGRQRRTDQAYLLVGQGLFAPLTQVIFLILGAFFLTLVLGHPPRPGDAEAWLGRTTWVTALPPWLQFGLAVMLADFLVYWTHWSYHHGFLWRFHAIHHSTTHLDWLAAVRVHPLGTIIGGVMLVIPLALLGFDPRLLAGVGSVIGLAGLLVHANVPWDFGPLRYVIASPAFHRWHHADEPAAYGKNLAAIFPIWDLLFGTWHLPPRQPLAFGAGEPVPEGFWKQFMWAFNQRDMMKKDRS
jgi:sterol desaturase/sphingolipid hydroxylase (fatty acid hydroxylase superfamily)